MRRFRAVEGTFTLFKRKSGIWYYWTYDKYGHRWYKSTGVRNKQLANQIAVKRAVEGTLLTANEVPHYVTMEEFTVDFYIYETCPYIQGRLARGYSYSKKQAKTSRTYMLKYILKYFGKRVLESITVSDINRWLIALPKREGISNKTANNILTIMRQIFSVAKDHEVVQRNPAQEVKPLAKGAGADRRIAFTRKQIGQLFGESWNNNIAETACRLSAQTGMRAGEIRALWPEQIHHDYIEVNASFNNCDDGRKTTKSGYSRFVPITPEIFSMLQEVSSGGRYVFSFNGTHPVSSTYFEKYLLRRMETLGIKAQPGTILSFHSFRHYFNTRLIAAGVQGEKIRAVIGHEDESMTEHYAHLEVEDLKQILAVQAGAV